MQVKVVRHLRRAKNADGDVKHLRVFDHFEPGGKPGEDSGDVGPGKNDLGQETAADGEDQSNDERLDVAKAFVLELHHRQDIERSDADAPHQRNLEQQVKGEGRTEEHGQIASADGQ